MGKTARIGAIVAITVGGTFAMSAPAFAVYGPTTPNQPVDVGGLEQSRAPSAVVPQSGSTVIPQATAPTAVAAANGSTLPFTGGDVEGLAAIGAALVAIGFGARHLAKRPTPAS